jgi:nucleotide-binding universal stress UspA family protein
VLHGQELLDHAIDEARSLASGLTVSGVLRGGHAAARELLAAATDADVLVLGTHDPGAGLGNTVSAVLHKAPCNVLVSR